MDSNKNIPDGLFEKLDCAMAERGYTLYGRGDRHGNDEWSWQEEHSRGDDITRFVTLSLSSHQDPVRYVMEVWAGAHWDIASDESSGGQQFERKLVGRFASQSQREFMKSPMCEGLMSATKRAVHYAGELTLGELHSFGVGDLPSQLALDTDIEEILGKKPAAEGH